MAAKKRKVALGGPGYAYPIRKAMAEWLEKNGYEYKEFGSTVDSQPYVEVSQQVAEAVASGEFTDGVLMCWSGIGPAITANKVPGIRAAVITDVQVTEGCRKGNGINVITSGTKYLDEKSAVEVIKAWMSNEFCLPQWVDEVNKINDVEKKYMKTEKVKNWAGMVAGITRIEKK